MLLLAAVTPAAGADAAFAGPRAEYLIESALLYNFTKFVEWPPAALGGNGMPFEVGVAGDDAIISVLRATLRNKTVNGHPVEVRRIDHGADPKGCLVLYVGGSDRREAARILLATGESPVLTVGDYPEFSRKGGVVALIHESNRIRFEINLDAAERAGLEISSQLLRLAAIWREAPPPAED